ncbi:hypothetical protein L9F63_001600, partial [Diploptera punctata]
MEEDGQDSPTGNGVPFKVVDLTREKRKGVVAGTLQDLISRARDKMGLSKDIPVKIVLEQDGTEVDDDEYFSTMERNTTLMILINDQRWLPPGKITEYPLQYQIIVDEPDASGTHPKRDLGGLVERLQGDLTHISMLGGKDLELLSDMDPESLADIMPD